MERWGKTSIKYAAFTRLRYRVKEPYGTFVEMGEGDSKSMSVERMVGQIIIYQLGREGGMNNTCDRPPRSGSKVVCRSFSV